MKYLYTTEPDEGCREFKPGIYGRPAHTGDQKKLLAQGWKYNPEDLEANHGLRKDEKEGKEDEGEVNLSEQYEQVFGRKPHHKMKPETIREKLEKADDQS